MRKRLWFGLGAISRREFLTLAMSATACALSGGLAMAESLIRRRVPRTGELLPIIGLGTWQTFDVGKTPTERAPLRAVLRDFVQRGGSVVDSSPMYGESERVVGDLAAELDIHRRLFLATKIWTTGRAAGIRQMEQSLRLLRAQRIDLMQVHNLVDWRTHLGSLREWKDQGRIRYIGVTHYTRSAYGELARVLETEELDFVQLNYSLAERDAEKELLPLARNRGVAVLVNRPFAAGALFSRFRGKPLPPWAAEIGCGTWAQFFLKFVIAHPAVTCALPATSKLEHLADNIQAGHPPLPDAATRDRMARYVNEL
jgi:aryl-alcohol dehydrogenase-like predicted oxidoreductase